MIPPNENQKMFVLMPVLVMSFALFLLLSPGLEAAGPVGPRTMSPQANEVDYDNSKFGSDPVYDDKPYSAEEQIKIYGDKKAVEVVRPLLKFFDRNMRRALLGRVITLLEQKTPLRCSF